LSGSTAVSTHDWPHCVVPAAQVSAHAPFEQTCALVASQVVPQTPQFSGSVFVFVQVAPHWVWGDAQVAPASVDASTSVVPLLSLLPPQPPMPTTPSAIVDAPKKTPFPIQRI
jgi:hypothetical protein